MTSTFKWFIYLLVLILRLLDAFGLERPCTWIPPNVLYEFQKEKTNQLPPELIKMLDFMIQYDGFVGLRIELEESAAEVREIVETRYRDMKELKEMHFELRETFFPKNKFKGGTYDWD